MSLQLIAKQMEAKGRGGDSMLVHMTPDEVAGLQKLAESAGGSLTVNPDTGLVEANFLKRMLPTLVGIGVGIGTGNPFLGAAAGAAVGGVQAKENKQDVGMGMLMGGLGGYGGAGLGAGLTAAGGTAAAAGAAGATTAGTAAGTAAAGQQATALTAEEIAKQQIAEQAQQAALAEGAKVSGAEAANLAAQNQVASAGAEGAIGEAAAQQAAAQPTMYTYDDGSTLSAFRDGTTTATPGTDVVVAKPELTTSQRFSQAGEGIGQLSTEQGRAEFGKHFGMTKAGMSAAPLMAPGKAPGEAPVDDEMYSYTFDPGRTGAERAPSATSAEREYFQSSYSPMRRIRASEYPVYAAQGGLMQLAEGGETAAEAAAPSASEAALAYLMGERSSSSAGLPALAAQTPTSPTSNIGVGGDNMYAFNPATGAFTRNPYYVDRSAAAAQVPGLIGRLLQDSGGSDGSYSFDGGFNDGSRGLSSASVDAALTDAGFSGLGYSESAPDMSDFSSSYDGSDIGGLFSKGGIASLAKGGMASGGFVVPADVVSALGNGSTDAGLRSLNAMLGKIKPIKGKGDGLSDSIKTSIDGKQPARVADGEAYIDPKTVKRVGGAKKLYAMMDKVRAQAHGKTSQQRKVNPAKVLA